MRHRKFRLACLAGAALAAFCSPSAIQVSAQGAPAVPAAKVAPAARSGSPASSGRAAHAYDAAVRTGPLAVQAFLAAFPKGADLHFHMQAGVYAEKLIQVAGEDKLCIDPALAKFARNERGEIVKEPCPAPLVAAGDLSGNLTQAQQDLYDRVINSFSMRNFVPTPGFSGHDQFFSTFDRFSGLDKRHAGDWIDNVTRRADAQNQQYLELMQTPASIGHIVRMAHEVGWNPDLAQLRQALFDHGLRDEVAADREEIHAAIELRNRLQHCGTTEALPACRVQARFIYQILRANAPEQVFAQTLLGFETVEQSIEQHSDDWVGINFVQPEDYLVSMRDYSLHMKMVDYLHGLYPKVHITLHAGELASGMVPPEGMRFHIRQAVELGHAERIGHGVDVMYEDDAPALLKELARKHVMIEVNLSSNEGILGIKGAEHPFQHYRTAHVPVALSTDDQGVSRIDITHEYVRAALDYHLSYQDLKQLVRTGMEHNFLPGESLFAAPDEFTALAAGCKGQEPGAEKPSSACRKFLDGSERAAAQWELERRFREFEAKF